MGGGKETPRQKMVGLMYLVLMALLAMNVSKEVIKSFVKVNEGLEMTKKNALKRNQALLSGLSSKVMQKQDDKVSEMWLSEATKVQKNAKEMINYIAQVKENIIDATLGLKEAGTTVRSAEGAYDTVIGLKYLKAIDNYDVPTNTLGLAEPGKPASGKLTATELQTNIEKMRDDFISMIEKSKKEKIKSEDEANQLIEELNSVFNFEKVKQEDGSKWSWVADNFYHATLAASVTLLSKLEADIANAESAMIKYFYDQVGGTEMRVNKITPTVLSQSAYVVQGDSFRGKVVIAAFDTTQLPTIILAEGGYKVDEKTGKPLKDKDGRLQTIGDTTHVPGGILNKRGDKPGDYELKGIVQVKDGTGAIQEFPFHTSYKVAAPSATIAAAGMNVFYAGVPNPLDVSASGFDKEKLTPSCSGCSIKKTSKGYMVSVRAGTKKVTVSVSGEVNGKKQALGKKVFKVKRVPVPSPSINGVDPTVSTAKVSQLKNANQMIARMNGFLLEGYTPTVKDFVLQIYKGGKELPSIKSNGNKLSSAQKRALGALKKGDLVTFTRIRAKSPDGSSVNMPGISVKIK